MKVKDKDIYLFILRALAWDADNEGVSTPSIPKIAEHCPRSQRAIQTALRTLEADGKVGIKYQDGHNTKDGKTNRYFLNDYRVSIGLNPIITESPYKSKVHTSPRAISNTKAVKFQSLGGEAICTHNNISKQNILNTTTQGDDKNLIDNEGQRQFSDEGKLQSASVAPTTEKKESAMHVQRPTDQSAGDIEFKTPSLETTVQPLNGCGEKAFLIKEETPTDLIFPLQMSKVEQAEVQKVLIQNNIPHQEWQDIIDTLANKMKQEPVPSKAGYIVGIVKAFKNGTFTKEAARKIQSKRQPKQTSISELKNKIEQMAQRNAKPVINEETAKVIETINRTETKAELQKIFPKLTRISNDLIMKTWSKRFNEVRA
jgi:hypothetical protein